MTMEESILSRDIIDIALGLFGKDVLTLADASIISVACNRNLPIYSDNRGIYWFFYEFLQKDYKKEQYKSAKNNIESKIKNLPTIYRSASVILTSRS